MVSVSDWTKPDPNDADEAVYDEWWDRSEAFVEQPDEEEESSDE